VKSSFQTILIGIFIAAFVFAVLVFSGVIKIGSSSTTTGLTGQIKIWGSYPQSVVQDYLGSALSANKDLTIIYEQKDMSTIKNDLIEALADQRAPDIVIADSQHIFSFKDKLYTIPFSTYNERLYRDSFIDGASIFLSKDGVMAVPLTVDPVVLYYNKNLLAGQNYVVPPTTWSGLVQSLPRFVRKDARGVISQTAIGLGESDNINYFKDILSALFLQTGNPIVSVNPTTGLYQQQISTLAEGQDQLTTAKALDFYTSFANQASSTFSWTRTLPSSLDTFLSGKSAFYIGHASELFNIQQRNPNLSFDVTTLFQADGSVRPITYGLFTGASIIKSTPNFTTAYSVLGTLSTKEFAQYIASAVSLPSTRRDLLLEQQKNPYVQAYFKSALASFSWPDPDTEATDNIFRDMIRAVNSGRSSSVQAIYDAGNNLKSAIR
jgi:ABC-type glycerol-3-phosphate transport system substrate-binding protein